MFHPLVDDISKLKDNELEAKILDLSKKYHIAARSGQGSVCSQILLILNSLKEEMYERHKKSLETLNKRNNEDIDGLINVD